MTSCTNPSHDHTTMVDRDNNPLDAPLPMTCLDCGEPAHYDEDGGAYAHDDPCAPECFLMASGGPEDGGTLCTDRTHPLDAG